MNGLGFNVKRSKRSSSAPPGRSRVPLLSRKDLLLTTVMLIRCSVATRLGSRCSTFACPPSHNTRRRNERGECSSLSAPIRQRRSGCRRRHYEHSSWPLKVEVPATVKATGQKPPLSRARAGEVVEAARGATSTIALRLRSNVIVKKATGRWCIVVSTRQTVSDLVGHSDVGRNRALGREYRKVI